MLLQNWWFTSLLGTPEPIDAPLRDHIRADVLIIGAGAAGLAAAMSLIGKGLKIVILERNVCGGSSTGKSAGFLTPDSELELSQILRRYGRQGALDLWGAASHGIDLIVKNVRDHDIQCDLQKQDSLFLGNDASGWKDALAEVEARKSLGYVQTTYSADDLHRVIGAKGYTGAVRYPGTYGINALRYAQGIKRVLLQAGVQIHEASEVVSIEDHCAKTHLGSVTAENMIVCIDKMKPEFSRYSRNVYHAQTFLSISEPLRDDEIRAMFPDGNLQCWDSDLVYSYYRLTGDGRVLLGGGSALTTFSVEDLTEPHVINRVIAGFKKKFPALRHLEFIQYWPGRIDTTRDLMPTVVRDPQAPWMHYVLGCVGLPWATFCGDFAGRHAIDGQYDDHKYYNYFRADRPFFVPLWLEKFMGKQLVFSLNNCWAKYRQVDQKSMPAGAGDQADASPVLRTGK